MLLLSAAAAGVMACNQAPSPASSVPPSSSPATISADTSDPMVSRWPLGLPAVIVHRQDGLMAVGEGGPRFIIPFPDSVATAPDPSAASSYLDVAASDNGRYLAYRFWGTDVTVCSMEDGRTEGTAQAEPRDEIEGVSDDARYVFLVDRGKEPGISGQRPPANEPVAVADTRTGARQEAGPVEALLVGADRSLGLVRWSPHHQAFLLQIVASPCAVYLYDPIKEALTLVSGIDSFRGVSDTGVIVGGLGSRRLPGGGIDFGRPVVWDDGTPFPVKYDYGSWDYGVAISPDGTTLVFDVVSDNDGEVLGWQVYRRKDGMWRSDSALYGHPVNYVNLIGISEDNRLAGGVSSGGGLLQELRLSGGIARSAERPLGGMVRLERSQSCSR